MGLLLKVTGGGGALGTEGGGLVGGGAVAMTMVVADPGEVVGGPEAAGDCGAYQGCRPTDCIQAILSHLIVCQSSLTKPPVSPAHVPLKPRKQICLIFFAKSFLKLSTNPKKLLCCRSLMHDAGWVPFAVIPHGSRSYRPEFAFQAHQNTPLTALCKPSAAAPWLLHQVAKSAIGCVSNEPCTRIQVWTASHIKGSI